MEQVTIQDVVATSTTRPCTRGISDCIRSREKPNCDVEQGHTSTSMSLLAKISHTIRKRLEWDPVREQVTNCPEANDLLHYEYRAPWKLG